MASTTTARPRRVPPRDESSVEPYRVTPRLALRVAILGGILLAIFAALFLRLWALQVLSGQKYVDQAQANSFRTLAVPAKRGLILDRNGIPLVTNTPTTAIQLWPSDLPRPYGPELARLAQIARVPMYEIVRGIQKRKLSGDLVTPVIVRESASNLMVNYLLEHAAEFPGVSTGRAYIRHYPYPDLAPQVLGYVGSITQTQLNHLGRGYSLNDEIGKTGAEAAFDKYLRGVAGATRLHVDNLNRPLGSVQPTAVPKPGNSVRLTLNVKLQQAAEKALAYGINLAQSNGEWAARGGAIVALDPRDGSILAMASSPSYKPSVYSGRVTTKALAAQGLTQKTALAKNYPSLNRAMQATYPPGSVFKPVTALAAMQEHLVLPYAYLPCTGTYQSPN
ncbi:MAG: penicillin-binding transpeptidase domain-containing protein, partial [Actinomycetota bacterium]|nr:penicillin-binding transpeptidase domain-containing protein [Actinomycetota bacterium]